MAIENAFNAADEMNFAPAANIEADFFSGGFDIPEEKIVKQEKVVEPSIPNWKFVVNRAFMRGLTANDILNSIGEEIKKLDNAEEVLKYIQKYEGLIGTVFVDISVLDKGFPISAIPKKFEQLHRFAINCKNFKKEVDRSLVGMKGGEIDDFLNSNDELQETVREVCQLTGLPVLKKGMFTKDIVAELIAFVGGEGSTLKDLQKAIKENILGIIKIVPVETEKADLAFGLSEGKVPIDFQEPHDVEDVLDYALKERGMTVEAEKQNETVTGVKLDYRASAEDDISFEDDIESVEDIKLDDNLRF